MWRVTSVDSLARFLSDLRRWLPCFTSDSGSLSAQISPAAWTRFRCYLNIYVLITFVQSRLFGTKVFYHFHKHLWKVQSRELDILCFIWSVFIWFLKVDINEEQREEGETLQSRNLPKWLSLSLFFFPGFRGDQGKELVRSRPTFLPEEETKTENVKLFDAQISVLE